MILEAKSLLKRQNHCYLNMHVQLLANVGTNTAPASPRGGFGAAQNSLSA